MIATISWLEASRDLPLNFRIKIIDERFVAKVYLLKTQAI